MTINAEPIDKAKVDIELLHGDNALTLLRELDWLGQVIELRIKLYFQQGCELTSIDQLPSPELQLDDSLVATWLKQQQLGFNERLVLILALAPHIKPQALDTFFIRNSHFDKAYTEFGGWNGATHRGFLPTAETAVFILAGEDIALRLKVLSMFDASGILIKSSAIKLRHMGTNEPFLASALEVEQELLQYFCSGTVNKLNYSSEFPAALISSSLSWKDLVLGPVVYREINKIKAWVKHSDKILNQWGLEKSLKPGFSALFYGPPGTGKTLTATLIGAELGMDVYRIDLSSMVSKYIGETEKNLASLFDQAMNKKWVLFFDEADALFGSRSQVTSSHDKHANQEVSYLLQRLEDYPGIVILSTNLKDNIDEAFSRRFQSLVYFPMPDAAQRLQLWQKMLNGIIATEDLSELKRIANEFELAGGAISNVVRYAAINAAQVESDYLRAQDIRQGIARELRKEGKTI